VDTADRIFVGSRGGGGTNMEEDILGMDDVNLLYVSRKRGGAGERLSRAIEDVNSSGRRIGGSHARKIFAVCLPTEGIVEKQSEKPLQGAAILSFWIGMLFEEERSDLPLFPRFCLHGCLRISVFFISESGCDLLSCVKGTGENMNLAKTIIHVPFAAPAALSLLRRYSGIDSESRNGFGSLHSVIVSNPERK
jgi:hypothetical protein